MLLGDWMDEMSSILERQARGVIDLQTAEDELDELHDSMELSHTGSATSKLPFLFNAFRAVVLKFSGSMSPRFSFVNTPSPGISILDYEGALEYLDYAIEKYADYGSSLGFDTWSTVCEGAPDHPRCD